MFRYNLRAEENPSPVSSSISTPRHRTSLSGSSASGSVRQLPPDTNYSPNSPMANNNYSMARTNGKCEHQSNLSLYSSYYAEACIFSASLHLAAHNYFRKSVEAMTIRRQHCVQFNQLEIKPQASRSRD